MPVYPISTPVLSFDQNNGVLVGYGEALRDQLMRAQQQQMNIQNQYLPQMQQADINLKNTQAQWYPTIAQAQYLRGQGIANANAPDMRFARLLNTLSPTERAAYFVAHPEAQQIYNNSMNNALGSNGAAVSTNPQPSLPQITNTNAPVSQTIPSIPIPVNNFGNTVATVNQAGMGNNLTVDPNSFTNAARLQLQNATSVPWKLLPEDQRRAQVAQATAFGIDPLNASQFFANGGSLQQLASAKGFGTDSSKWPTPQFAPTTQTLSQAQQRISRGSELDSLGNFITQGIGPYSGHVLGGYSPKLIVDLMHNQNDPATQLQLANFLAANSAGLDEANLRAVLSGNPRPGIEVGTHLLENGLQKMKIPRSLINSQTWTMTQNILNQQIKNAASQATNVSLTPGSALSSGIPSTNKDGSFTFKGKNYSSQQINETAKNYGMTPNQVIQYLQSQSGVQ